MSGDPERLLSAAHADPLERELLGSVRQVGPPAGAKDLAWKGIAAQIAVAAAVGVATGSSTAAAAKATTGTLASWAGTKVAAVVAASGLALGGGYAAIQALQTEPPPSVAPRTVVKPPVQQVAPQVVETTPAPEPVVAAEEAPSRRPEQGLGPRQDLLKAESALLTEARAQLRSGNAAGAQASLDKLQQQFPKGMLSQEREVLAIEVLSARGNVEGAKRRAKAFVKAHPKSPHSAKLSRFVD
jgi:TolA-binding protein